MENGANLGDRHNSGLPRPLCIASSYKRYCMLHLITHDVTAMRTTLLEHVDDCGTVTCPRELQNRAAQHPAGRHALVTHSFIYGVRSRRVSVGILIDAKFTLTTDRSARRAWFGFSLLEPKLNIISLKAEFKIVLFNCRLKVETTLLRDGNLPSREFQTIGASTRYARLPLSVRANGTTKRVD